MDLKILTDLSGVLDLVHDRWFDLEEVKFDQQKKEVTFRLGEKRKGPYNARLLKITGVLDIDIRDDAKIGIYDLCDIEPDPPSSCLRITSGFPLVVILRVADQCTIHVLKP